VSAAPSSRLTGAPEPGGPGRGEPELPLEPRAALTYRFDRIRGACSGILETGWQTFALLVAVRVYEASPNMKALLVSAGSIGLVLTPIVLFAVSRFNIPTGLVAGRFLFVGAVATAIGVVAHNDLLFILSMIVASIASAQQAPLMVNIYSENYPPRRRGRLLSQSIVLAVVFSALFAFGGGYLLDWRLETFPWIFATVAVAAAVAGWAMTRMPSSPVVVQAGRNPLQSLSWAWKDKVFGTMLGVWMLMGLGNLLIIPLRVEYMANDVFGINASNADIALAVAIIPAVVRMLTTHAWGWLFDNYNFFVIRTVLNGLFLVGIMLFFTTKQMWLLMLGGGVFGLAMAGGNIAWNLWVTKFAPPERVPAYMSVHTFMTGFRGVLAPFIGFHLITHASAGAAAWISAGLIGLSMLLLGPARRRAEAAGEARAQAAG
jgi:MFS family permease